MKRIRITGGSLRSRSMEILERAEARYTPSKVKQAVFNIIGSVEGLRILDLFAGSGSFSVEALSRGAGSATCVERSAEMSALIRRNMESLSLSPRSEVLTMEAARAIPFLYKRGDKYDIIFMDPPYDKGYVHQTVSLFRNDVIYDTNTLVVIEHSKREMFDPPEPMRTGRATTRRYGDTCITIMDCSTILR
jgi:16S rRNA (guanine966-N2)-methyltransferase